MHVFCTIGEGSDKCFAAFKDAPDVETVRKFVDGMTVEGVEVKAQEITDPLLIENYPYSIDSWPEVT